MSKLALTELIADSTVMRCELVAGDFFESIPEGGDAYVPRPNIERCSHRQAFG